MVFWTGRNTHVRIGRASSCPRHVLGKALMRYHGTSALAASASRAPLPRRHLAATSAPSVHPVPNSGVTNGREGRAARRAVPSRIAVSHPAAEAAEAAQRQLAAYMGERAVRVGQRGTR